ncbi:outer membrane protein assembly factor BamB family protein [Streptomyces sp. NPDC002851]
MSSNGPGPGHGPQGAPPQPTPPHVSQVPQQPAHGFPQHAQQASPAQQQAVSPQSACGYPQGFTGPGFPGQQPALPAGPRKKSSTGLIVGLLVALVVFGAAGGAAWLVLDAGDEGGPLWSVPTQAYTLSGVDEVDGVWFTDEAVVQTAADGVKAYDKDSGERLWEKPLPGSRNVPCLAPAESSGDIGFVAYGASDEGGTRQICDHLVAYDLKSGAELWNKKLEVKDEFGMGNDLSVARVDDVVVVRTEREHLALKVSDGRAAWDVKKAVTAVCNDEGAYTGGKNLIRVRSCSKGDPLDDGSNWNEISLIDPESGTAKWTTRVKTGDAEKVASTSPIVIRTEKKRMYSVDETSGRVRQALEGSAGTYITQLADNGSPWRQMTSSGSVFVVAGSHPGDPDSSNQSMAAYDLNSGERLWETDREDGIGYFPVRAKTDGKLLAYKRTAAERPELVEVDMQSGDTTTLLKYPEDVRKKMSALARPFWNDGRIFIASLGGSMAGESYGLVALPTKVQ